MPMNAEQAAMLLVTLISPGVHYSQVMTDIPASEEEFATIITTAQGVLRQMGEDMETALREWHEMPRPGEPPMLAARNPELDGVKV